MEFISKITSPAVYWSEKTGEHKTQRTQYSVGNLRLGVETLPPNNKHTWHLTVFLPWIWVSLVWGFYFEEAHLFVGWKGHMNFLDIGKRIVFDKREWAGS